MKYIIRLTESELYRVVGDIAASLLREDGIKTINGDNNGVTALLKDLGFGDILGENRTINLREDDNSLTDGAVERTVGRKEKAAPANQDRVRTNIENELGDIVTKARNTVSKYEAGEKNFKILNTAKELYPRLAKFEDSEAKALSKQLSSIVKALKNDPNIIGGTSDNGEEFDPTSDPGYVPPINIDRDDFGLKDRHVIMHAVPGEEGDDVNLEYDPSQVRKGLAGYNYSIDNMLRHGRENHSTKKGSHLSVDNASSGLQGELDAKVSPTVDYVNSDEFREMLYNLIHLYLGGDDRAVNILEDFYGMQSEYKGKIEQLLGEIGSRQNPSIGYKAVRAIITNSLNTLRNTPEFKTRIQELLQGKYDIDKARPIDQKDLTASGDEVNTTKIDLMKKDYMKLIKNGFKAVNGYEGGAIKLPETPKFTKDEFLYLFASELIPNYDRLSEKDKKSKLGILDNLYTHRFYNKWFKNNVDEGAFDKYQKDLMDIELDRNMNVDDMNFSTAYAQLNDPMVRKVKGSTMRSMMSDTLGNNIVG